jgi:hypothetical protein
MRDGAICRQLLTIAEQYDRMANQREKADRMLARAHGIS